ncbi:4-hydroxy-tetrahydrodipicolinate synthase [Thiorhodococcus minor]|uniref:4-hydroxy-tetrahydrodipicolinate synthase n=1 Tax=Thiorhodococcus minor TaxID=57489 RepID=A0A6M0K4I9_9GAMM|nr:4-hydroxy-tetrahydrodipicolinate synthase [Thiorhodococcus minor]NEV63813.1 4-hydroxy-tetrahydrodipicolinate synthase [Thiorhodococcus minor]
MFRGSIVALVTPMHADGEVDDASLKRLVDFHVAEGTTAIVSVGTTGESATLDEDEHCAVIRRTVELAAGRIPIIAGTGANSTREAIVLTRCAQEAGADAALLVTPYYNKPTQEGLYLHHKAIAEAVDIPQILYNVPGRTACDMQPETVSRLAEVRNIIGVKEATGDLTRVRAIRERCGPDFAIYSGDDATACELMLLGGDGVISVTSNLAPRLMREMCEAALRGDRQQALAINAKLDPLHRDLFVQSNPIPVKWAVAELGLCAHGIRLPLTWLSDDCQERVRTAMSHAGLL